MAESSSVRRLKQQIDMIRDTAERETYDVIVRMQRPGDDEATLVTTIAGASRQRGLSISSRDFLPVSRAALQSDDATPRSAARRELRRDNHSIGAQIAKQSGPSAANVPMEMLRQMSRQSLLPLLSSDAVREAAHTGAKARQTKVEPVSFWTSNSVVI
ncbi:MAG TPA: hypothetical protein VF641_09220 [Methylobacterium sp.]